MIITIICDVLGEENNGTTITSKRLIDNLKARGHEVRVVSPSHTTEPGYYNVKTYSFGKILNKYVAKNGVELAKADKAVIARAIDGADVVHIMLPFSLGQTAIKMCKKRHIPVTAGFHTQAENVTAHFGLKNNHFANGLVYRYMHHVLYKKVDAIHCPSHMISVIISKYGYGVKKFVISNGVSEMFMPAHTAKPEELKDKFLILFVGRYAHEKRQDILIDAVKASKHEKEIQLVLAGEGPMHLKVKQWGNALTNHPIMNFYPKEELVKVINYCDLYVHPSDAEIEAISCLEAITCGLVPIISDSPQSATNAFALSEKNVFNHKDPTSLAGKIDYWIEHPEERANASKKYVEYASQFAIQGSIDQMETMFRYAIKMHQNEKDRIRK